MRYRIKINQSKLVLLETVSHPFPRLSHVHTHVHTRLYMHLYEILTQEPLGIESGQFLRWYNWFSFHSFKVLIAKFSENRYEKSSVSRFDIRIENLTFFYIFFSWTTWHDIKYVNNEKMSTSTIHNNRSVKSNGYQYSCLLSAVLSLFKEFGFRSWESECHHRRRQ